MAWGDDYGEIRRSRVELWRNLDRIKLEVGAEENKKVLKIISDLKRSVKAALRWSISQDNQLEVIVNEKICKDSVVVEDNGGVWLFIPLELKNKETRVEIERKK
jgi:tRNA threonylcarbamoyladenosine modification (KEOPS) complex  Pcc1 subunit